MQDFTITGDRLRTEVRVAGFCLLAAFAVNALAIVSYGTSWVELVTTLHITAVLGVILYAVSGAVRVVLGLFARRKD